MKSPQAILISFSLFICFSQTIYSSESSCSSEISKLGPITSQEYLSNLIEESYKEVGLQKTLKLLDELKEKCKNNEELSNDIDAIINKINTKKSINEVIFPPDLSNLILNYTNPYDEFENFKINNKKIQKLAWSPDGKNLAIVYSEEKIIKILNIETQEVKTLTGHTKNVENIAWSPDGQILASSAENTIRIWDVNAGQNIKEFGKDNHHMAASCLAFSPDGKYLASGDWNGKIFIWDANTFKLLRTLNDGGNWVLDICWSPDSNILASTNMYYYNQIDLWNINDNQSRNVICNRSFYSPERMKKIIYTKDGKYILSGTTGYPNKVIWEVSGFQEYIMPDMCNMLVKEDHYVDELEGTYDTSSVFNISCSHDSKIFVTRSGAGITKIWGIETRELIQDLTDIEHSITSIAFSPVENIIALGHENGEIKLFGKTLG